MNEPVVVEVVRSGAVESVHLVDAVLVGPAGDVLGSAGDPDRPAAFRSAAKPIQARVALEAGWEPADAPALAIACASHSGEPAHVRAVRAILAIAGLAEAELACPEALPLDQAAALAAGAPARITHNCSGKHAGMLAACAAAGWPTAGYRAASHPLQLAIAERMRSLLGADPPVLIDGCGVPTFVAPLASLARAFAAVDDGGPETAAMRAEPFLVGGTGRLDTDLMRATGLVAKGGAESLLCVGDGEHALALKVRDGGRRALGPAAVSVLEDLGWLARGALADHHVPAVLGGGEPVGSLRARGRLGR